MEAIVEQVALKAVTNGNESSGGVLELIYSQCHCLCSRNSLPTIVQSGSTKTAARGVLLGLLSLCHTLSLLLFGRSNKVISNIRSCTRNLCFHIETWRPTPSMQTPL